MNDNKSRDEYRISNKISRNQKKKKIAEEKKNAQSCARQLNIGNGNYVRIPPPPSFDSETT